MRRAAVVVLAVAVMCTGAVAAAAFWTAGGSGTALARATTLGAGNAPAVSVAGRKVNLSWAATSFSDGTAASGYTLRRYAVASGGSPAASLACPANTCAEDAVPPGSWYYGVAPSYGTWSGAESTRAAATVAAPSLAFASASFSSLPATLSGTVANLVDGETLEFRIDDATTGTILAATLDGTATSASPAPTVATGGSGSVTVTIPTGTASGAHTVHAVGSREGAVPPADTVVTYSPAATLALSPTSITTFPVTLTAGVTDFAANESVAFRLDSATGPELATATADAGGSASVGIALRCAGNGTHTVHAVSATRSATATFTVSGTFCPLTMTINNKVGGTAGLAEANDTIVVEYSGTLSTTSLCSSFTGATLTGATVRITTDAGLNSVVVDGPTGSGNCAMKFGSIDLGTGSFNTGNKAVRFDNSSMGWDQATRRLTITLGVLCTSPSCGTPSTVSTAKTATYAPNPALTTTSGTAVTGSAASTAVQF